MYTNNNNNKPVVCKVSNNKQKNKRKTARVNMLFSKICTGQYGNEKDVICTKNTVSN